MYFLRDLTKALTLVAIFYSVKTHGE